MAADVFPILFTSKTQRIMEMVREYGQIKFKGLIYSKRGLKVRLVRLILKRCFISYVEVKYLK